MDTDFWVVLTGAGPYRVTEQTAVEVRAEVARHAGKPAQENQELAFTDLADSRCYVPLGTYLGIVESTAEQRRADRQLNKAIDKEKEEDDPSWK
jgi:hypothetical protein